MYEVNGVTGHGDMPSIAGTEAGPAIVIAGAACVWDDVRAALALFGGFDFKNHDQPPCPCTVVAVNDIGVYFAPQVDHLVSHHEDELEPWRTRRRLRTRQCSVKQPTPVTHTHVGYTGKRDGHQLADVRWRFVGAAAGGTSALLAVGVALALGHDKVILCGVPMDGGPHFFGPPWTTGQIFGKLTLEYDWCRARDEWLGGRVRSMSGRTAEWLGKPDRRWIDDSLNL